MAHVLLQTHFPDGSVGVNAELERTGRWEGELVQTDRHGRTMVVECRRVLICDEQSHPAAIFSIARDITERRKQEQAQATVHTETLAQRTFLQELLDALPSGVSVVHGREARLVLTNRAAASIWGAQWLPGQPMRAFLEERHILPGRGFGTRSARGFLGDDARTAGRRHHAPASGSDPPALGSQFTRPGQCGAADLVPLAEPGDAR